MTVNVLALVEEVHVRTWQDGKYVRHPESHFLDYVIDGTPLRGIVPGMADLVTNLNRAWRPEAVAETVEILLGRRPDPDLGGGRVPLLVCGACGGLDCGALTARLSVTDGEVRWSEWQWVDSEGERDLDVQPEGYRFDRTTYETTISAATQQVSRMPFDELAHRGKRFRWPWQWGWKLR